MQRFFSSFPDGRFGAGLLLLRAIASLVGVSLVLGRLIDSPSAALDMVGGVLAVVSSLAVLIGFFTPVSATVLAITVAWFWFPLHVELQRVGVPAALMTIAVAIAISLLGPGAFSIDARLFGPREIVISRNARGPRT